MDTVAITLTFAQDLWNIIHKARHPHFESEIIDQAKNGLFMVIKNAVDAKNAAEVPPPVEEKAPEAK